MRFTFLMLLVFIMSCSANACAAKTPACSAVLDELLLKQAESISLVESSRKGAVLIFEYPGLGGVKVVGIAKFILGKEKNFEIFLKLNKHINLIKRTRCSHPTGPRLVYYYTYFINTVKKEPV